MTAAPPASQRCLTLRHDRHQRSIWDGRKRIQLLTLDQAFAAASVVACVAGADCVPWDAAAGALGVADATGFAGRSRHTGVGPMAFAAGLLKTAA